VEKVKETDEAGVRPKIDYRRYRSYESNSIQFISVCPIQKGVMDHRI
jgi:hypothetical protein